MADQLITLRPNRGSEVQITGGGSTYRLTPDPDWGETASETTLIEGPDIVGAVAGVRRSLTRERSFGVQVRAATSAAYIAAAEALVECVTAVQRYGGVIVRQLGPLDALSEALECEIHEARVTEAEDGWLEAHRLHGEVRITLTTQPAWLADEALLASLTASTASTHTLTVPAARGNLPGPGRVKLADNATKARRFAEIGAAFESYVVGQAVEFRADAFDLTGADGTLVSTAVADKIGTNTISVSPLLPAWRTVGFLRALPQKATQALRARLLCVDDEVTVTVRALWRAGTGAWRELDTVEVPSGGWWDLAFGSISRYDEAATMDVRFDVRASVVTSSTFRLNVANVTPTDMYVVARGKSSESSESGYVAYDGPSGIVEPLNGHIPALVENGNWVSAGGTGDFNPSYAGEWLRLISAGEALNAGRYAAISATAKTATTVNIECRAALPSTGAAKGKATVIGAMFRKAGATSFGVCGLRMRRQNDGEYVATVWLATIVAGTLAVIKTRKVKGLGPLVSGKFVRGNVSVSVTAAGAYSVSVGEPSSSLEAPNLAFEGTDSVFATGGALASGTNGVYGASEANGGAVTFYGVASAGTTSSVTLTDVVRSGGIGELTHEYGYSADTDGSNPQDISEARGKRISVPPNLPGLLSAKVRSSDSDAEEDTGHAASTDLYFYHRPAFATISDALE